MSLRTAFGATIAAVLAFTIATNALALCRAEQLEKFLKDRAFELSADEKIGLYADRLVRYYDKRDVSRRQVLRQMRAWENRWPKREYKYLRIHDYKQTENADACRVTFDYRFLAYSPDRDAVSAGIRRTTLVLFDIKDNGQLSIIGEFGTVRCRGLKKFAQSKC